RSDRESRLPPTRARAPGVEYLSHTRLVRSDETAHFRVLCLEGRSVWRATKDQAHHISRVLAVGVQLLRKSESCRELPNPNPPSELASLVSRARERHSPEPLFFPHHPCTNKM